MTTFKAGSYKTSTNGVMDLYLEQTINLSTHTASDIESMANSAISNLNGWSWNAIDHIMYVLSNRINFEGAAAYAYLPGDISVFDEDYAPTYLVQMHEFGHNLGQHHSGLGSDPIYDQYNDPTCWMGAHVYEDEGPASCFNGAKSWDFGWYSSNSVEIDPQEKNSYFYLIGINDFLNGEASSEHTTVVKIIGDLETLYMMYNKQEGINSGTAGYGDTVTIVHQPGPYEISWFRSGLNAGQKYEANNFRNGKNLVVEVCEMVSGMPDIAKTIVYLDGFNNISCDDSTTASPVSFPQVSPTASPLECPTSKKPFQVQVQTDNYAEDITFYLQRKKSGKKKGFRKKKIFETTDLLSNQNQIFKTCVLKKECYRFTILDSYGDGLCCIHGQGWYSLTVNGRNIKYSTFESKKKEKKKFGCK